MTISLHMYRQSDYKQFGSEQRAVQGRQAASRLP